VVIQLVNISALRIVGPYLFAYHFLA